MPFYTGKYKTNAPRGSKRCYYIPLVNKKQYIKSLQHQNLCTFLLIDFIQKVSYLTYYQFIRKKYQTIQRSTGTLQRMVRGFLARRRVRGMRRTKAATIIQSAYRGHVQVSAKNDYSYKKKVPKNTS